MLVYAFAAAIICAIDVATAMCALDMYIIFELHDKHASWMVAARGVNCFGRAVRCSRGVWYDGASSAKGK